MQLRIELTWVGLGKFATFQWVLMSLRQAIVGRNARHWLPNTMLGDAMICRCEHVVLNYLVYLKLKFKVFIIEMSNKDYLYNDNIIFEYSCIKSWLSRAEKSSKCNEPCGGVVGTIHKTDDGYLGCVACRPESCMRESNRGASGVRSVKRTTAASCARRGRMRR